MPNKTLWDEWEELNSEIKLLQIKLDECIAKRKELNERLICLLTADKSGITLTRRQFEVLKALNIYPALANKEIASQLNVSERTVKFHVSALLRLYKVHSRADLRYIAPQEVEG